MYAHDRISPYAINQHIPAVQDTQPISRPRMVDTHTQTEIIRNDQETQTEFHLRCPSCEWHYDDDSVDIDCHEIRRSFEISLINKIKLIPIFINRRCGNWARISTIHIIRLIPCVISHPITCILQELEDPDTPIDVTYPNIPHKIIPILFHTHDTLLYLIRVMIGAGVVITINAYTTKSRWRYTVPPLLNRFEKLIYTFYEDVLTLREGPIHSTIRLTFTLVIRHLQRIVRYEFQQLHQQVIIQYQSRSEDTNTNDLHSYSNTVVAHNQHLPYYMRKRIYKPYVANPDRQFTSDDIFNAFYHPENETDIQDIIQYRIAQPEQTTANTFFGNRFRSNTIRNSTITTSTNPKYSNFPRST